MELSISDLDSEPPTAGKLSLAPPSLRSFERSFENGLPRSEGPPATTSWARWPLARRAAGLLASHALLAGVVAVAVGSAGLRPKVSAREPNAFVPERKPLVSPAAAAIPGPPAGGCAVSGSARVLASRAQLG
ncbi:MAG TPA: hypothetical protein VM580_02370, partial [Labilithrix sp.]|nr:hypothetical protein [Labilithrix sp.]